MGDGTKVSDQDTVWFGILDELKKAILGRLLNTRGGEQNTRASALPHQGHRFLVATDILEVGIEFSDSCIECGGYLIHGTAENSKNRSYVLRNRISQALIRLLEESSPVNPLLMTLLLGSNNQLFQ